MNIESKAIETTANQYDIPIKMDYLFVISDAGERNVLTAILKEKKEAFGKLDYMIVFSGASVGFIKQEPFASLEKERMININDLGIDKVIDSKWDRTHSLSAKSIKRIIKTLQVQKAVITGASQSIFAQIHSEYKTENPHVRRVAIWENPNRNGNTTYFSVGITVAKTVSEMLVPSEIVAEKMRKKNPEVKATVVGLPSLEDFEKQARALDKEAICKQVSIDPNLPIIVISGATDSTYTSSFTGFLDLLLESKNELRERGLQLISQPHPSYTGKSEKEVCQEKEAGMPVSRFVTSVPNTDDATSLSTLKALAIADVVVCTDPTSLVVFQAASIDKKVVLFNTTPLSHLKSLISTGVLEKLESGKQLADILDGLGKPSTSTIYDKMQIPKGQGFEPFWNALIVPEAK